MDNQYSQPYHWQPYQWLSHTTKYDLNDQPALKLATIQIAQSHYKLLPEKNSQPYHRQPYEWLNHTTNRALSFAIILMAQTHAHEFLS